MEQRDYLQKQIDQLGLVLTKLLADLVGLKITVPINAKIEATIQNLKNELNIDFDEIINMPKESLIEILKERKLSSSHIQTLADILCILSEQKTYSEEKRKNAYERILLMYEYTIKTSSSLSLDVYNKIEKTKKLLAK